MSDGARRAFVLKTPAPGEVCDLDREWHDGPCLGACSFAVSGGVDDEGQRLTETVASHRLVEVREIETKVLVERVRVGEELGREVADRVAVLEHRRDEAHVVAVIELALFEHRPDLALEPPAQI